MRGETIYEHFVFWVFVDCRGYESSSLIQMRQNVSANFIANCDV